MIAKRLKELLLGLAILPMIAQPVFAHAIWIVKGENQGEYKVVFGHPEENKPEAYDSIKFQEATAYAGNGMSIPLTVKREDDGVTLVSQENITALTAKHDNGYFITVGENQSRNVFRPEALKANNQETKVTHTYKFAKAFYEQSRLVFQPLGLPLEIIPRQDPYSVGAGEKLEVQVLYQGKPQEGVTVEYAGEEPVKTNAQGVASITFKQQEVQVIEAEYRMPSTDDAATDEISYATTLTLDKGGRYFFQR
jgi:nickel transport protein